MSVIYRSTLYVDTHGIVMDNRVFLIHAAIEEVQSAGYLSEEMFQILTFDERQLVIERATARGDN